MENISFPQIKIYQTGLLFLATLLLTCQSKKPLFQELPPEKTGINFQNKVLDTDSLNILNYLYFYNGGGVAVGDVNNDGLDDIFFTANHKGQNKLYLNKGNFRFEDISKKARIKGQSDWNTGVSMADVNADGWLDIYVCGVNVLGQFKSQNQLFINQKDGTFLEEGNLYGLNYQGHTTQAAFFDKDNDGDLDCFLLNHSTNLKDYYQDTTTRRIYSYESGCQILENQHNHFINVTKKSGIYASNLTYGLGISVGDLNYDGWQDVYISNDFRENDYCYINNQNGTFTEKSNQLFGHHSRFSMGNDMADFNNDGALDLFTTDMLPEDEKILKTSIGDESSDVYDFKRSFGYAVQHSKNCLQVNQNNGEFFTDESLMRGVAATDWSWSALMADFDNDGFKDLFISNGIQRRTNDLDFSKFMANQLNNNALSIRKSYVNLIKNMPEGKVHDYFFQGNKNYVFTDKSEISGFSKPTLSNGAAYSDLDNDGDLDLVVNRENDFAGIYQNNTDKNEKHNFLKVKLIGTKRNLLGVGARVTIYAKNQQKMLHQMPTRGFQSSVSPTLHFGLGDIQKIDSILVEWNHIERSIIKQVSVNQNITTKQEDSKPFEIIKKSRKKENPLTLWKHQEDDFNDFANNPFITHKISTQGPKITVGDVNSDGLEDFFVCGAKNQSGALFFQLKNQQFQPQKFTVFEKDSVYEDTDALFFDADNDHDLDLYVTSGGNEFYGGNENLKDRLYLNNGKGIFSKSPNFPTLYENKSCVRACDFDKDGDLDLFVGGRVNARMYGMKPASSLLINHRGNFQNLVEKYASELNFIGMVTDASWADIDQDGWQDLIVVGEFMSPTIFKNKKGKSFEKQDDLQKLTGLWNCIFPTDIDNDGDTDFLVGNWGLNSKLKATPQNPLYLNLSDFDDNGELDAILSFSKNGKNVSFLGKEDLEKRLPYLKKAFFDYKYMAGLSVEEIFGHKIKEGRILSATTLQSGILLNLKGKLTFQQFDNSIQKAPIFSFEKIRQNQEIIYLAGGNFYGTNPNEGRYDALPLTYFKIQNNGPKTQIIVKKQVNLKGEIRTIKTIKLSNKNGFLIGRNNDGLELVW